MKSDRGAIFGNLDGFRDQPVERERLVQATCHQAFDGEVADAESRHALDYQLVETVKRPGIAKDETPAFWRVGIDVGEVSEARRLFGLAIERNGMRGFGARRSESAQQRNGNSDDEPGKHSGFRAGAACGEYEQLQPITTAWSLYQNIPQLRPPGTGRCGFATMCGMDYLIAFARIQRPRDCRNPGLTAPPMSAEGRHGARNSCSPSEG
jgi:hypothetical protein